MIKVIADSYRSCGTSLLTHLLAKLHWKIAERQQINTHPQQILEFDLKTAKIEKRGAWQCIYPQIKVTPLFIRSEQCRTKHARIGCTKAAYNLANGCSLQIKSGGGLHFSPLPSAVLRQSSSA